VEDEAVRIAEEAAAEVARQAAEAQAELERIAAEEAAAEIARVAAEEAAAEIARVAAEEAAAEIARVEAEAAAEAARIAAEEAEIARVAAEEAAAELVRVEAEAAAEAASIAAEEAAAEEAAAEAARIAAMHRYEIFDEYVYGFDAQEACASMGAKLATFHSDADIAMLGSSNLNKKWVGVVWTDSWGFSDGTALDYSYWAPGEPNGNANEPCVVTANDNGQWNDWACNHSAGYICEWN